MSMIENQISEMKHYIKRYQEPPYGREIEGTVEVLERAISTIQDLSAKLAAQNMEQSSTYYNGGWILVEERLPEESLNSVIGWDNCRGRCCFVQYYNGRWILGDDTDSVDIVAWMPLPEPYRKEV